MKYIQLTQGKQAIVDDKDFESLNKLKWRLHNSGYAFKHSPRNNYKRTSIFMHRLVNNTPVGFETDHVNHDKLDNRKCNLRTATRSLNQQNKGIQKNNTSGYTGVIWHKLHKRWESYVKVNKKVIYLGNFINFVDAVLARKQGEKKYYGI